MIYLDLFLGFLKVGCFAFGGAYGAIPLVRNVVMSYGWLSAETLTYMIAVSESTPGPIMVNLATYVGSNQAGFWGCSCCNPGSSLTIVFYHSIGDSITEIGLEEQICAGSFKRFETLCDWYCFSNWCLFDSSKLFICKQRHEYRYYFTGHYLGSCDNNDCI